MSVADDSRPSMDETSTGDDSSDTTYGRSQRQQRRRYGWWLVSAAGLLAVLTIVVVTSIDNSRQAASPSPSASLGPSLSQVSPSGDPDEVRLDELIGNTIQALRRAAPAATLEISESSSATGLGSNYSVYGMLRANGRLGSLRVIASRQHLELACGDFTEAECRITAGPRGETIRVAQFERPVRKGQPRDLEIQVTVYYAGDSWVEVTVDNAAAPFSMENPTVLPPRTGQPVPLTVEQTTSLATDPTLDTCATAHDRSCIPT